MQHLNKMLSDQIKNTIIEIPDFPKPGISFKDITPIFKNPALGAAIIDEMEKWAEPLVIDVVVGIESRGFMFGYALAQRLGVPFIPIRKAGKLPRAVHKKCYDLEYGSACLELQKGDINNGSRVLVHDDLLATGGTATAAINLCEMAGASVVAFHTLVELCFLEARENFSSSIEIKSLASY